MSKKRKGIKRKNPLPAAVTNLKPAPEMHPTQPEEPVQPFILVGTPAYGSMVHTDFLHSIIDFIKCGLQIATFTIGNESLITRGRNSIISYFYEHPEYSHLLYLDADIGVSAASIAKLILHGKDVIGAPVPLKGMHPETGKKVYNLGEILSTDPDNPTMVTTEHVGTAVFILSRKAVDALVESADTYGSSNITRGLKLDQTMYDVFQVGVVDGNYLSEDYFVCDMLRKRGFDVWVDTSIEVRHNGNVSF
jgi:hypothetical protein